MSDRSWFFASNGQQQGPYPEAQLRELISRGTVRADTLVWSEGMAGWQKAGEIPGLMAGGSRPPAMPNAGGPPMGSGPSGGYGGGGALSIDLPILPMLGRFVLLIIGYLVVIPAPWTGTEFYRWMTSRVTVPGRPNLAFTGQPLDIWYVFVATGVMYYVGAYDNTLQLITLVASAFLSWVLLRWLVVNLSSNGQPLPLAFTGNVWTFVGWQLLMYISFITIIGWAWVVPPMVRWICRNIAGTRREIVFTGSGWEILWRTFVFSIACIFIIPIPWMLVWLNRWYVSQFALVERA